MKFYVAAFVGEKETNEHGYSLGRSNFARSGFLLQAQDRLPDPDEGRGFGNPLGAILSDLGFTEALCLL